MAFKPSSKLEKILRKLSADERKIVLILLEKIVDREWDRLDIKKLKGHKSIYRVRKGDLRIIFSRPDEDIRILSIDRRNEPTYKKF